VNPYKFFYLGDLIQIGKEFFFAPGCEKHQLKKQEEHLLLSHQHSHRGEKRFSVYQAFKKRDVSRET
jgi:hypothetical protein